MKRRITLIALGLAFGIWESIDIFRIDVPAVAAVFAAMFLASTIWFWLRDSSKAATCLLALFAFEAAVAPSLKQASTTTKTAAFSLGVAGAIVALTVLATEIRRRHSTPISA